MHKGQGNIPAALAALHTYLASYQLDWGAWEEAAELYIQVRPERRWQHLSHVAAPLPRRQSSLHGPVFDP